MIWLLPLFLVISLAHSSPPTLKKSSCSSQGLGTVVLLARNTLPKLSHDLLPYNKHLLRQALLDHSVQSYQFHSPSTLWPLFIIYVSLTMIGTCSPFICLLVNSLFSLTPLPFECTFLKVRDWYLSDCYLLLQLQSPAEGWHIGVLKKYLLCKKI